MRLSKIALLTLCLLLSLPGIGAAAFLPDLANWGGADLLALIQDRVNGKVTAGKISGNPLTGLTFEDLEIAGPDGKPVLTASRLEIRLSLWSLTSFRLDLGTLALVKPRIHLSQSDQGEWNIAGLLKPEPEPAPAPGLAARIAGFFLRELKLSGLSVDKGEIFLTQGHQTRHFTGLDLTASLTLLNLGRPEQALEVSRAELGLTLPQGRAELATRFTYKAGQARLDRLNLKLAGQTVAALQGEVCRPAEGLACTLAGKIGPLAGDKVNGFWPRWPAAWDLSGTLDLSSGPEGGAVNLKGKIGQADYALRGSLDAKVKPAVFSLDLDLTGLTTAQLKEIQDLKAQSVQGLSPVNARLHVEGTGLPWTPETLATRLTLEPFRYQELSVQKVQVDLSGNARDQELQVSAAGNFGAVDLAAEGRLLPLGETGKGLAGDLTIDTKDFQPALVGLGKLPGTSLTTCFTGKFRLPPSLSPAHLHLTGNLQASGRVNQEPLKALTAGFVLEGRKLTVSQADVEMGGVTASLKGTLTEANVDINFTAALAGSRALPLPPGVGFASLRAEGSVRGPWKSPQAALSAQVQKASFQGVALDSANLSGSLAGWPPQSGDFKLQGSHLRTPAGVFNRLQLTAGGAGGRWQFQLAATSPKELNCELAGSADLASRPLAVQVTRVNWYSPGLKVKNQGPFQVNLFPGWEISPATFTVDGGTVTLAALARDQELSGRLDLTNLNAALLAPLGLPASGRLSGRLTLAGRPQAPVIDGQLALSGGAVKNIPVQNLTTTLSYQDDKAQVAGYLEVGPLRSRLIWKGAVPLKLSLSPFAFTLARDGLDLRLHSERVNLSLLAAVSKEVKTAEGPIDLEIIARGDPHQPKVSGHVRWSAGSLLLHQAGTPYRLTPGEIRLQGDKIVIPNLVIQSDGTLRLSGEIAIAAGPQAQARVQADKFQLLDRGGNQLWANGFLDLKGPLSALVVNGRLIVPKAQFRPTFFRTGMDPDIVLLPLKPKPEATAGTAPPIYRNLSVNVSIDSTGNAWLIDPMGKVELAAHLTVKKDPGQKLAMGGEIHSLGGTLDVQERPFKVERAVLLLPGVAGKPITLNGKAVHEMDDITLVLIVNGTLTNPQIHLESLPPLPPADVLSYLVFGAPSATLTKEQYMAMGAQTLGVLGGITPQKIDEILGATLPFLSGIKVKSGIMGGRPTVGVGKDITKNVSVFAGRNLNEERGVYEQQVGIQYKFNKHLSVESQIGQRNSGADVYFNYDF